MKINYNNNLTDLCIHCARYHSNNAQYRRHTDDQCTPAHTHSPRYQDHSWNYSCDSHMARTPHHTSCCNTRYHTCHI